MGLVGPRTGHCSLLAWLLLTSHWCFVPCDGSSASFLPIHPSRPPYIVGIPGCLTRFRLNKGLRDNSMEQTDHILSFWNVALYMDLTPKAFFLPSEIIARTRRHCFPESSCMTLIKVMQRIHDFSKETGDRSLSPLFIISSLAVHKTVTTHINVWGTLICPHHWNQSECCLLF